MRCRASMTSKCNTLLELIRLKCMTLDLARIRSAVVDGGYFSAIEYVPQTGSTNTDLLARDDVRSGTVLLTDEQLAGKGRLGRTWTAPCGTQAILSVALHTSSLTRLGVLPLAAGLAITDTIPGTVLKWPNDVHLNAKKLAGILCEAGSSVVIGMGINVSLTQEELPIAAATSLELEGQPTERTDLIVALLRNLSRRIDQWEHDDPQLMADYRAVCSSIGKRVRLEAPGGDVEGTVDGVTESGQITIDGASYSAGDVTHLRLVD